MNRVEEDGDAKPAWLGRQEGSLPLPFLSSHLALFVGLAFVSFGSGSLALCRFPFVALPYKRWRRGHRHCRLTPPSHSRHLSQAELRACRRARFLCPSALDGGWMLERLSGCVGVLAGFLALSRSLGSSLPFLGGCVASHWCVCVCREGWA